VEVGQQVTEERVGGQTVGQRLGNPRWRHRTGLAQRRAHRVRPSHPTFSCEMQEHLFVGGGARRNSGPRRGWRPQSTSPARRRSPLPTSARLPRAPLRVHVSSPRCGRAGRQVAPPPEDNARHVICESRRTAVPYVYARGMRYNPNSLWVRSRHEGHPRGLLIKIGSRSPRRRCSFEVTVAHLFRDAHRIRCAAVWRVAADV